MSRRLIPIFALLALPSCIDREVGRAVELHEGIQRASYSDCASDGCAVGVGEPIVSLTGDSDPTGRSDPFYPVVSGPGGTFLSSSRNQPGVFLVWDSSGAVTERLGREGDGPGESSGTVGVLFDGQRYHVLGGDGRWTILKSNGEYVSSVAGLFAPPGLNIIVDDTLVVSGWAGQSQFRVTDLTSGRQTELGKAYGDGIPDAWTIGEARGPGEFWAVSPGGDRVERWSVGGELLETLVTSGTVYDPASTREGLHAPQPHYFLDLMVGEDLIWVVGGLREGSLEGPPTNFVEVLDRWTGRSLAHALEGRYGPLLHGFIDSSTGWIAVEDELGATEIKLRSFGLVKSAG